MTSKIHSAFLYTGSSKFSTDIYILISIWSSFQPSTPLHSHSLHRHISYSINRDKKVGKGCSYFPNWFCARPILIPGSMMATWSQDKLALFLNNNKNGLYLRPLPLDTQRFESLWCFFCVAWFVVAKAHWFVSLSIPSSTQLRVGETWGGGHFWEGYGKLPCGCRGCLIVGVTTLWCFRVTIMSTP